MLRGDEPLGMGMFSERVDLDADDKLIQWLILGGKRVAHLLNEEDPL